MTYWIGLLLCAGIGISLGLIGGGGSIITVPVLVYGIGVNPHQAIGMSLAVVGSTSLIGTFLHARKGVVDFRTGAQFAGAGILTSFFGSRLTRLFTPEALLLIFALLMLIVASIMLIRRESQNETPHQRKFWKEVLAGAAVGGLTGFLGVGGGFLIVPALVLFGGLSMKSAIGTSLMVISINCASGLAGHITQDQFSWRTTVIVTAIAVSGAIIGTRLSHRIHSQRLRKVFAMFVILVAVFLIVRNYKSALMLLSN